MTDAQKAARLRMALDALHNADAWMQAALGNTEECFDLHCGIENMADDLQEVLNRMEVA